MVIVGGGQAAVSLIARLRELGHEGGIMLVGDEPILPYQRPPLSKKYLSGHFSVDRLILRPESWYSQQRVELHLGIKVISIDRLARRLHLSDGHSLAYNRVALTTGSQPRRLPAAIGGDLCGVYTMRNVADADAVAPEIRMGRRMLVIGGGYIGLEIAAVASVAGVRVTLIETADRILQRVAATETADFFRALHRSHGVDIREKRCLTRLFSYDGHLIGAELDDGNMLSIDCVMVGIGILPNDDLARDAGLAVENGIAVDQCCRTSDPAIFAAGDCTSFTWLRRRIRLELVQNAIEQAKAAAAAMLGIDEPYFAKPWFWSDQFDVKLQIAGLSLGYDDVVVRPGETERSQSVWYYRGEELLAVDAMNEPSAYLAGRRIVEAGKALPKHVAADPTTSLKDWC